MEGAQQHAVCGAGHVAVGLVLGVVHLARRGAGWSQPQPTGSAYRADHRIADPGRDRLGVPDIQRQARPAQPGAGLQAAQERREPAGAGEQVHRRADDRPLTGLPGRARRPGRAPRRLAWRCRSSSTHSRTRSSRTAAFTSPVTIGAIAASHAIASAASPLPATRHHRRRLRRLPPGARPRRRGPGRSTPLAGSSCPAAGAGPPATCAPPPLTGCPARSGSRPEAAGRRSPRPDHGDSAAPDRVIFGPRPGRGATSTAPTTAAPPGLRSPVAPRPLNVSPAAPRGPRTPRAGS